MPVRHNVGQVCLNGHVTTDDVDDGNGVKFCDKCGAETISSCQSCGADIRGSSVDINFETHFSMNRPAFCYSCGHAFPWTERALKAANDLADEIEQIDAGELQRAKASFVEVTSDTAQTGVAVVRIKKLLLKAGPVVGGAIKDILVSVATEAAKKQLGL